MQSVTVLRKKENRYWQVRLLKIMKLEFAKKITIGASLVITDYFY